MTGHPEIAALLKRSMGMDIESVGMPALALAVRRRMAERGTADEQTYQQELERSPSELQELIDAVVVPETWFFREPEAFVLLGNLACEALRCRRPLRLLSLPCSTGEEPYSMAMTLLEKGMKPRDFRIDAMDISQRALEAAAEGIYGRHSFRGTELAFRDRHFRPLGSGYELAPHVRECVRFHHGNLHAADLLSEVEPYDFIFCRNVLIYFNTAAQEKALGTIRRLLAEEGGTLFVAPAEAFLARESGFIAHEHARAFAFVTGSRKTNPVGSGWARRPKAAVKSKTRPAPPRSVPALVAPASSGEIDLNLARRLADTGQFADAKKCCEEYLQARGDSADAHFLAGLVHDAMGNAREAASWYRKAVYLEQHHAEALLHLSLLVEKEGDHKAAQRLKQRAQRIEEESRR